MSAVTLHVAEIDRSRKFYREVLGLTEITYQAERRRAVFAIPGSAGTVLTMHEMGPQEGGRPPGTVSGIIFSHREPAKAMEEIRRRGGDGHGRGGQDSVRVPAWLFRRPGRERVRAIERLTATRAGTERAASPDSPPLRESSARAGAARLLGRSSRSLRPARVEIVRGGPRPSGTSVSRSDPGRSSGSSDRTARGSRR